MTSYAVSAPAKINLHLEVLGRRSDGYHELRTLFISIDLADRLRASRSENGVTTLHIDPEGRLSPDEDNLIIKAAELLRRNTGSRAGANIFLNKNIPVGAGLGGGSSDAAAALVLLDKVWGLGLDNHDLMQMAAALGSDVPFFLHGGLAEGRGRGDDIRPLPDLRSCHVVVVVPKIAVSTASVFASLPPSLSSEYPGVTPDRAPGPSIFGKDRGPSWHNYRNDLEAVVVTRWPEVGRVLASLRDSAAIHVAMTGSGSASFAVFENRQAALEVAAGLDDSWTVHVVSTLGRNQARMKVRPAARGEGVRSWK